MPRCILAAMLVVLLLAAGAWGQPGPALPTGQTAVLAPGSVGPNVPAFTVRPGYRVTLAAEGLAHARFMEFDDQGNLYLAQMTRGEVTQLRDSNGDGFYDTRAAFATDLPHVHGLHWHDGWLWMAPSQSIVRGRDTSGDGKADQLVTVLENLPGGSGHLWRSLLVDEQGLYTSVGDTGNIEDETATDRQKIWHYRLDGTGKRLFASGIRNTEKLRFRPGTKEVWGADHGSDMLGQPWGERGGHQPITDLLPPDEFNHYVEGGFYGHPFLTGDRLPRLEYRDRKDLIDLAAKTIPPAWSFGAHWATNGFTFLSLDNAHFPPDHRGDAFVGCHGSWNSSVRVGYKIERVLFDPHSGKPYGSLPIVSTLTPDGSDVLGRPVDCVEAPDGTILFSDDLTQRIYRIEWVGPQR